MVGDVFHSFAKLKIPTKIDALLLHINDMMRTGDEYGIFLCHSLDLSTFEIKVDENKFFIPAQSVTTASIRFMEHRPSKEFSMVIHRHPAGCTSFSGPDNTYINEDFDVSAIFIPERKYQSLPYYNHNGVYGYSNRPVHFPEAFENGFDGRSDDENLDLLFLESFQTPPIHQRSGRRDIRRSIRDLRDRAMGREALPPVNLAPPSPAAIEFDPKGTLPASTKAILPDSYQGSYPCGIINYPIDRKNGYWLRLPLSITPPPVYNPEPIMRYYHDELGITREFLETKIKAR